jgi:hypothetical protein
MGLGYHMVEALIRESQHRPIEGDVILIGRQTTVFTAQSILGLLREHGVDVEHLTEADIEIDRNTINRQLVFADQDLISDAALFRLLDVPKVLALDHSDYEGAEIIHDLNTPIPERLRECADFIVDGSTLDNVFDPAMVISNFAAMLRPGGRLITTNMYSNYYEPYVILPPLWYLDYFVYNAFADCKVYIVLSAEDVQSRVPDNAFTIDLDALLTPGRRVGAFTAPGIMATIVMAEKAVASTSNLKPAQQHYRSASDWKSYRNNLQKIQENQRHHLVRTRGDISFFDVKGGHFFMANDFTARDPWTEMQKSHGGIAESNPPSAGQWPMGFPKNILRWCGSLLR